MSHFTITTSIAYPNAAPHFGYALELVQADFLARAARSKGLETFFLTGVDQHGQKIQRAAEAVGQEPFEFVTATSNLFEELCKNLNISYDRFIRTTDSDHIAMAQALWSICEERGDIYRRQYQAWYDIKEESFLGSKEEFPDPSVFETPPEFIQLIDEENYFFRQSRYQGEVIRLLETEVIRVIPKNRAKELLHFIKEKGLPDISISRSVKSVQWGIPVPGDDSQVMYVWFDALTNYLTATAYIDAKGIEANQFWPTSLHCVGKDIQRFHALLWPAMLLSAGLALPETILVHGFLSINGKKMSKSLGNVLDPVPLIEKYGSDAIRWFLLKEVSTTGDADLSEVRIAETYAADLSNTLGNLVSRLQAMIVKYADNCVPKESTDPADITLDWFEYHEALKKYDLKAALEIAFHRLEHANRTIESRKPWILAKDPAAQQELHLLLYQLLEGLRHTLLMLEPALPTTVAKLGWLVSIRSFEWGGIPSGTPLPPHSEILFPRIDPNL